MVPNTAAVWLPRVTNPMWYQALRETAERESRSMQEVARAAIHEYVTCRTRTRCA